MDKLIAVSYGIKTVEAKGKTLYRATANTKAIDRDNEIILPSGCTNLKQWLATNPVIFYGHAWMSWDGESEEKLPIGRAEKAHRRKSDGAIEIAWWFHEGDFAQKVKYLVDETVLNATSIGFIAKEWESNPEVIEEIIESEGIEQEKKAKLPGAVCTKWELLELSVVSIPSNREAEILRSLEPESALALALKSVHLPAGKRSDTMSNSEDVEEVEADATPPQRCKTFAEKYQGVFQWTSLKH